MPGHRQKLGETRNTFSPGSPAGRVTLPDFGVPGFKTVRKTISIVKVTKCVVIYDGATGTVDSLHPEYNPRTCQSKQQSMKITTLKTQDKRNLKNTSLCNHKTFKLALNSEQTRNSQIESYH